MKSNACWSIMLLSVLFATDYVNSLLIGHGVSYRSQYLGLNSRQFSRQQMVATDSPAKSVDRNSEKQKDVDWSTVFVNALIKSPLYTPIVAMARDTMIKTAASVGVDWKGKALALRQANPDWKSAIESIKAQKSPDFVPPAYYMQPFHGYTEGNLCLDAALEQELAGKAVGVRNFPEKGIKAESFLRECNEKEISILGGYFLPDNEVCVDFGCGTGTSTRRLAKMFPNASKVIGIDLSPYMLAIGGYLMKEISVPKNSITENGLKNSDFEWVDVIEEDDRVEFRYDDIAHTDIESGSVGFVNICLVLHELPAIESRAVLTEAFRILKPGGTLAIMEMDPTAPGYIKLKGTPWLFAILKSTEPFLEEYFDFAPALQKTLASIGFPVVRTSAATGRHFTMVAVKGGSNDVRPSAELREKSDSHLNTLDIKAPKNR